MAISELHIGPTVDVRPLFGRLRAGLLELLGQFSDDQWAAPTSCIGWNVRDVVAHMLGDVIGRLSGDDRATSFLPGESLERYIDRVNEEWVVGARRISRQQLMDMIDSSGTALDHLWANKDLNEPSLGVSWAGMDVSPLWFDIARELTELWVHESQIREAVGRNDAPRVDLAVVLDIFARGLPFTLSKRTDPLLEDFELTIGSTGQTWQLSRRQDNDDWTIRPTNDGPSAKRRVVIDGTSTWRTWTRQPGAATEAESIYESAVLAHLSIVHSNPC